MAALGEGIDLALANKESLVVGGELVTALAEATNARIVPVDSEHTALHQLISGQPPGAVQRLTITASGGPFRGRTRAELEDVTVKQALAHPTWAMGGKITIDSATLMNKGLELMEAHHLFAVPYDRIDVLVHPQSLVHGLVQLADGAMLAHLGPPDMRIAISYALHGGESVELPIVPLDLARVGELTFEPVDLEAFPCLRLAEQAARSGGTAPCILNAANEVAVHAFLDGRLRFLGIPEVIEQTLEHLESEPIRSFESLYEADRRAREIAGEAVARMLDSLSPPGRRGGSPKVPVKAACHTEPVSWVLTLLGICALIVLHELGHFTAAKAVGMRVERFSLFFPPDPVPRPPRRDRVRDRRDPPRRLREDHRDEPGGAQADGEEELDPELLRRAYYNQATWKRVVVIAAGPGGEHRDRLPAVLGGAPQRHHQRRRDARTSRSLGAHDRHHHLGAGHREGAAGGRRAAPG